MTHPKAYEPEQGFMYHILCRNQSYDRAWEHCDYAESYKERNFLIESYIEAYGTGWEFKAIRQPKRYWHKEPT